MTYRSMALRTYIFFASVFIFFCSACSGHPANNTAPAGSLGAGRASLKNHADVPVPASSQDSETARPKGERDEIVAPPLVKSCKTQSGGLLSCVAEPRVNETQVDECETAADCSHCEDRSCKPGKVPNGFPCTRDKDCGHCDLKASGMCAVGPSDGASFPCDNDSMCRVTRCVPGTKECVQGGAGVPCSDIRGANDCEFTLGCAKVPGKLVAACVKGGGGMPCSSTEEGAPCLVSKVCIAGELCSERIAPPGAMKCKNPDDCQNHRCDELGACTPFGTGDSCSNEADNLHPCPTKCVKNEKDAWRCALTASGPSTCGLWADDLLPREQPDRQCLRKSCELQFRGGVPIGVKCVEGNGSGISCTGDDDCKRHVCTKSENTNPPVYTCQVRFSHGADDIGCSKDNLGKPCVVTGRPDDWMEPANLGFNAGEGDRQAADSQLSRLSSSQLAPVKALMAQLPHLSLGDGEPAEVKSTIFVAHDPTCGQCRFAISEISRWYQSSVRGGKTPGLKFEFIGMPLAASEAAIEKLRAMYCAAEQGPDLGTEYLTRYYSLRGTADERLRRMNIIKELAIDAEAFKRCLDEGRYSAQIRLLNKEFIKLGINGTPTFIIFPPGNNIGFVEPGFPQHLDDFLTTVSRLTN